MHCIIIAFVLPRTHSITRIEVGVRAALRFSVPIPSMLGIILICATISRVGSTHGGNICECITLRSSGGSSFMIYEIDVLGDQKLGLKEGGEARDEGLRCLSISLMTTALRQVSMEFPPSDDNCNKRKCICLPELPSLRRELLSLKSTSTTSADVDIKKPLVEILVI